MNLQHVTSLFFGVKNWQEFIRSINGAIGALNNKAGLFTGDNLITYSKNLSFLTDAEFMKAFNAHATTNIEKGIIWRIATVAWAARNGMRLEGDFVECACYKGITARIVCDYVDFGSQPDRHYYLYDLFEHDASMPHHHMPEHSQSLFDEVKQRFSHLPNVTVTQGRVPESLAQAAPEKIAFLHLDLNNANAEMGALEVLFDRMVPGAIMVLDDYGWLAYRAQKLAEDPWLEKRGYRVMELPTGQGLLIK
ncbi:TylF/MycF/NovP-related O-methyltransferase [Rhizorhabdus argentea]|uniref:TylF/MycF/NovP-related O-methyltransferase n=1 Tax=Rhizorhabdus argentea TaxID=1387174 RepID=UPI0030ED7F6C